MCEAWRKIVTTLIIILAIGCKEQIVHDLSEAEANRLLTKLSGASLHPEKEKQTDGRWTLSVPGKESIAALTYLSENRIIREERSLPVEQSSLISSRDDQRFALERKLSGELESTLAAVAGILESRVHLNLPPLDPLFGQPIDDRRGSASVLIVVEENSPVERDAIASLVSGASGIPKERVSVLLSRAWQTKEVPPGVVAAATANPSILHSLLSWREVIMSVLGVVVLVSGGLWVIRRSYSKRLNQMIAFNEASNS